jgi:predicted ATP-grasp superfamily ATP-dependent carboligase
LREVRVIVLDGNENQAVAATRSLSRSGYQVTVGASESWSKAGWSRHAQRTFVYPSPREDADAFIDGLVSELRDHGPAVVLPMTERSTIPISAARVRLEQAGGMLVLPAQDVLMRVFDKSQMTDLAASLGVAVPRTWVVEASDDADTLSRELPFPVVLKPRASEEQSRTGGTMATGAPVYARTVEEFSTALSVLRERCSSVLVQEYVIGSGAGYFALMRHGELRGEFAHRRLRDVRPTGSGSALRESVVPSPTIRDASLALLRAVNWHGVAMVEFRIRPDGTPVFLEVNGRFWNSLALAIHAGVNFPLGVARIAEFGDVEMLPPGRPGVRCRWFLGDARHLLAVWRGAPVGYPGRFPARLGTTLAVLLPKRGTMHDNFTIGDPMPELGDWLHFVARRVPNALMGRIRGRFRA